MAEAWSYSLGFRGDEIELEGRRLTVGRSRACDVSIRDASVSRRHAELRPGGGRIAVRDLGSSNGTFINGRRVTETGELRDGDTLGLGDADLEVRVVPTAGAGEMGEATSILQAESMRLAQEALDEAARPAEPKDAAPELSTAAMPGAHLAPLPPSPAAGPEPPPERRVAEPRAPASPMATVQLPTVGGEPRMPAAEPPPPTADGDEPHDAGALSPLATMALPSLSAAETPPAGAPAAPLSPMLTQAIPDAGLPGPEPPLEASPVEADDLPAPGFPEPETEKVGLVKPARRTPETPAAAAPPAAGAARPMKDLREATLGTPPLPPPSGGKGEILPSLDGFDTTLGPGVPMPESMRRAQESLAKAREARGGAGEPLAGLYQRPEQPPPAAGFGIRALSSLADGAWLGLLGIAGWRYLGWSDAALAAGVGLVGLVVVLAGWTVWGTTPGKRLLRLYVCTADGQAGLGLPRAALRVIGYFLSAVSLGIGFLMVLSASRRGLHDRLAGTWVRRYG